MDTLSHALYGGVAFGRQGRFQYWLAFFFGMAPDLFSFGLFFLTNLLGITERPDWSSGHPSEFAIPAYIHGLYNITHSLVVFVVVFAVVWYFWKQPIMAMLAWPLHILIDIPTHSSEFFPTPFLWPLSDVHVDGRPWSHPEIFIPNILLLVTLYTWFWWKRKKAAAGEQKL